MTALTAARGTSVLLAGRLTAAAISAIWFVAAARFLSPTELGWLALGLSIVAGLNVLADLGIPMLASEAVARRPDSAWSLIRAAVLTRLAAAIPVGALVLLLYAISSRGPLLVPLFLALSLFATTVYSSVTAIARSVGSVHFEVLLEVASRATLLLVGLTVLVGGGSAAAAASVYAGVDIAAAVVAGPWAYRRFRRNRQGTSLERLEVRQHFPLRRIAGVTVALCLTALHARSAPFVIAMVGGAEEVAGYTTAYRVFEVGLMPATTGAALVLPLTATAAALRGAAVLRYVRRISAALGAVSFLLALLAPVVMESLFGQEYASYDATLRVLALALIPAGSALVLSPVIAVLRPSELVRSLVAGLAVHLVVLVPLARAWGATGAATATLLSSIAIGWALQRSLRQSAHVSEERASG